MQVTRTTNETLFELRTYRTGGGWKWEVTQAPIDSTEPARIHGVSHQPFWEERDAFEDGQRHLDRLAGAVE